MAKTSLKNLVSLIMEQVNVAARVNEIFPPDKYVFVEDIYDYPILFQTPGQEDNVRQLTPDFSDGDDNIRSLDPEPELALVAEGRPLPEGWQSRELDTPLKINKRNLSQPEAAKERMQFPPITSLDPETGEYVEDVAIGTTILKCPAGRDILKFTNYGFKQEIDRQKKLANYVVLAEGWETDQEIEGTITKYRPKVDIDRDPQRTLEIAIANEEDPEEKAKLERKLDQIRESNVKTYNLYPLINSLFGNPEILDLLDKALIPETWATPPRTEHTTNEELRKKFGGRPGGEIDADFVSVRDLTDVDTAINDVMDLRAELAMGDTLSNREREFSKPIPRQHANYIYANGNWHSKQRAHDEDFFRREGGKSSRYETLAKNIQEGNKQIVIQSTLDLKGRVQNDDEYVLEATFSSILNARNPETGAGESLGDIFPPIKVGLRRKLPEIDESTGQPLDPETFTLEKNPSFLVDGGRKRDLKGKERTGFLRELMDKLGEQMKQQIDPNETLQRMIDLVSATNENPVADGGQPEF